MADNNLIHAIDVYNDLCAAVDSIGWHYTKKEEDLVIVFTVHGDDLPMNFIVRVNPEKQLVSVYSPLSFKFRDGNRVDGAIAACAASYGLADGSFDYDISDGSVVFRLTATFRDTTISQEMFKYMVHASSSIVDEYNDLFLALDKGVIDIKQFIEKC
ncbi:MAG: YbjN domain-containing protein [Clostridia bacterium]|nr:YbjN domain-containing protein [Clostridia bacterium]